MARGLQQAKSLHSHRHSDSRSVQMHQAQSQTIMTWKAPAAISPAALISLAALLELAAPAMWASAWPLTCS